MTEQIPEIKKNSLSRPTISTPFHIDFEWWKRHDHNWLVYLSGYLCETHRAFFESAGESQMIDSVNPDTGEVIQTDQLMGILINHCAREENFIPENGTLTDSVFRLFLSNGNSPLSPEQISEVISRPAETILKTLSSARVYRGIKPA